MVHGRGVLRERHLDGVILFHLENCELSKHVGLSGSLVYSVEYNQGRGVQPRRHLNSEVNQQ